MRIVSELVSESTIGAFADAHNLVMKVTERSVESRQRGIPRYYAQFEHCDVGGDGMLRGEYGNGETPEQAIADYAPRISEKTLIIDAMRPTRREIKAPRLQWIPAAKVQE